MIGNINSLYNTSPQKTLSKIIPRKYIKHALKLLKTNEDESKKIISEHFEILCKYFDIDKSNETESIMIAKSYLDYIIDCYMECPECWDGIYAKNILCKTFKN